MTELRQRMMADMKLHGLAPGTQKVRYYGFWNPCHRQLLRRVQLVTGTAAIPPAMDEEETTQAEGTPDRSFQKPRKCPCCGEGTLVLVETIPYGQNIEPNSISNPVHELWLTKFSELSRSISCELSTVGRN